MTLTTRLCLFFLAVLAVVLAGFSIGLVLLAQSQLHSEMDDRLDTALHALVAAAGVEPNGIEWDRHERRLALGADRERVVWRVSDSQDQFIDGSPGAASSPVLSRCLPPTSPGSQPKQIVEHAGQTWWVLQRRLETDPGTVGTAGRPFDRIHPSDVVETSGSNGRPVSGRQYDADDKPAPRFPALALAAAVSLEQVDRTLDKLASVSLGLSVVLWLMAALVGRAVCRRALAPVIEMSAAARAMSAADLDQRLPMPGTHDEVEDLSRAFNDLLGRLQDSFERQRRFTGDASHQIRTPLTALIGQIEVALRRRRSTEEYERVLQSVETQAGRLRGIVEMLLFLARADSEARLPNLEAVSIAAWLQDHLESWTGHARAADLRFANGIGPPLWVQAQAPLLGQLVDNLLDNAFKYSAPGSVVAVRLEADPQVVSLIVEDSGYGIAPEHLPHVFDPFFRSPDARRRGHAGVGLGLAVAQRVAVAFGGSIQAQSVADKGSCFTVTLCRVHLAIGDLAQMPTESCATAIPLAAEVDAFRAESH